jgi:hypothetical protein
MLLISSAENEDVSPLEAAGAGGLVFVGGERGWRGCFDGEEPPFPLPAKAEREALDTAGLAANLVAPSSSPAGRGAA